MLFCSKASTTNHAILLGDRLNEWEGSFCAEDESFAGEFSIKGKMRYAIKANLIYYGTLLVIFAAIIIYLLADGVLTPANFMVNEIPLSLGDVESGLTANGTGRIASRSISRRP